MTSVKGLYTYTGPFFFIFVTIAAMLGCLGLLWWFLDTGKKKRGPRPPHRRYTFDERGRLFGPTPRCPVCPWEAPMPGNWTALDWHLANEHPRWRPPQRRNNG
jgi:hypothetical protein